MEAVLCMKRDEAARGLTMQAMGPALRALRLYWPAIVALQVVAVCVVLAYGQGGRVREVAHVLSGWKMAGGVWFVALANVVSGALLPELVKGILRRPGWRAPDVRGWLHLVSLMATLGVAVDVFYAFQGELFAGVPGPVALIGKILVDQFGYTLFVAMPLIVVWFEWKAQDYSFGRLCRTFRFGTLVRTIPPIFLPNLLFWIPALLAVYSLPVQLQFLLFVFLNAAWCIVLIFVAAEITSAQAEKSGHPQEEAAKSPQ
jgi:hypothetical protein